MIAARWRHALSIGVLTGVFLFVPVGVAALLAAGLIGGHSAQAIGLLAAGALSSLGGLLGGYGAWRLRLEEDRWIAGACLRCGYDLRGSQRRCPECGRRFRR